MGTSTVKDIAEKLNLSVATVSRAINNKEYVKEETRQRVLQALKEYNYVPNEIARSLKLQSTKTVAVIVPDICEAFFGKIIKGIERTIAYREYSIIVADTDEKKENEKRYLDMLFQKRIDALVFATVDLSGDYVKNYFSSFPIVFIDNIPELEDVDCVVIDNAKASRMAVEYLIERGHREIAVIIGSVKETTGYARREGYLDTLKQYEIPVDPDLIQYGNYKEDAGYRCMETLLEQRKEHPFTAVYVTCEMMTFGAIKAIHARGLRIPEDISLVGFDIQDRAKLIFPSITTVRQPESVIGRKVGELLLKRLDEKDSGKHTSEKILLEPYMEEGESVKPINGR